MSLASLKELLGRRTPGPWDSYRPDGYVRHEVMSLAPPELGGSVCMALERDAAAIVALSNAADELVAVAQRAQEAVLQYRHGSYGDEEDAIAELERELNALNDVLEGEKRE